MPASRQGYLKPPAAERVFGRVLIFLVRTGLVRSHFYVLEVRGRNSGRMLSLPVDPIEVGGRRYLVCARGESNWVRNARAAGEITLIRAWRRTRWGVEELSAELRPPVLKAYLDAFAAEVQRFFPVPKGSPVAAFENLARRYPVFLLRPLDSATPGRTEPR